MAAVAKLGQAEPQPRGVMPSFLIVAAAFTVAEYLLEMVPATVLGLASPFFGIVDAVVRATLVPFALLLTFYLLARNTGPQPRRSYLGMAVSIFTGTAIVLIPVDVGRLFTGSPLPGFTTAEAVAISLGDAVSSSLNHVFIGFSGVFLWRLVLLPPSSRDLGVRERLHGTEDLSLVGVAMVVVYAWEYLAQAYEATYQLAISNPVAAFLGGLLGAGSTIYYTLAIWQQIILLMLLPFALFFFVARQESLNPFAQASKIATTTFLWGLFLRGFTSYFYVYFVQLLKPGALAGDTFASSLAAELTASSLVGIAVSTLEFVFLGLTGVVFGYYSGERAKRAGAELSQAVNASFQSSVADHVREVPQLV